jgi:hypothetical protein
MDLSKDILEHSFTISWEPPDEIQRKEKERKKMMRDFTKGDLARELQATRKSLADALDVSREKTREALKAKLRVHELERERADFARHTVLLVEAAAREAK